MNNYKRKRKLNRGQAHHIPNFNGISNASKSKCWITLMDHRIHHWRGPTLADLADETGITYNSLSALLVRWVYWEYVRPSKTGFPTGGKGKYPLRYYITNKGLGWIVKFWDSMPHERYIAEMQAYRASSNKRTVYDG